ncbi:LarC family nickel insertion protein [Salsuginibacillus kocurii]|uniref:LarC family nickel insertion protein n=1 Tax=Salsuginibacillus kocurii TaxID=427078 RepID=UPI000366BB7A|nr:LarC family nickel insertion protein [Salsuginibacillus kocurii]
MNLLYLDCVSGIAGDMTLAALIDAGANSTYIQEELKKLPIDSFEMKIDRTIKCGVSSAQLNLSFDKGNEASDEKNHHHHRHAADILKMIETSALPPRVRERSMNVFERIAEAEGKIHGISPHQVHFHEVGAMDSIIDIIGVCLALENLEIDSIHSSPVPTGYGKIKIEHGLYPIPAPATAELLKGVEIEPLNVRGELTTPTGAGLIQALSTKVGVLPAGRIQAIGYGAGQKEFDHPNVLRAVIMEEARTL